MFSNYYYNLGYNQQLILIIVLKIYFNYDLIKNVRGSFICKKSYLSKMLNMIVFNLRKELK